MIIINYSIFLLSSSSFFPWQPANRPHADRTAIASHMGAKEEEIKLGIVNCCFVWKYVINSSSEKITLCWNVTMSTFHILIYWFNNTIAFNVIARENGGKRKKKKIITNQMRSQRTGENMNDYFYCSYVLWDGGVTQSWICVRGRYMHVRLLNKASPH